MPIALISAAAAFGARRPPKGPVKRGRSAIEDSALAKPTSASRMTFNRFCSRGSASGVIGAIAPNTSPTAASVNGASIFITSSRAGSRRATPAGWAAPAPCPITWVLQVDADARPASANTGSRDNAHKRAAPFVLMLSSLQTKDQQGRPSLAWLAGIVKRDRVLTAFGSDMKKSFWAGALLLGLAFAAFSLMRWWSGALAPDIAGGGAAESFALSPTGPLTVAA